MKKLLQLKINRDLNRGFFILFAIILIFLLFNFINASSTPGGGGGCPCGSTYKCNNTCCIVDPATSKCFSPCQICGTVCLPCNPTSAPAPPTRPKRVYVCDTSNGKCSQCSGDYCRGVEFSTYSECEQHCGNWVSVKKCVCGFMCLTKKCQPAPCRDVPPGSCFDSCQTDADCQGGSTTTTYYCTGCRGNKCYTGPSTVPCSNFNPCQTDADCQGIPSPSDGYTPDINQCIPRSCPCTYYKCENYCCKEFPGTYDCNCGTWNKCVDQCSPGAPAISFSIDPNRLFTNQTFTLSYRVTRKGDTCSNRLSCSVSGQYLGANCPNNIPQGDKLYICQNEAPINVFDPQNKLPQLSCNTVSSCQQGKSISLTPTVNYWGNYQYTVSCTNYCASNSESKSVFVIPVLYYQEAQPFSSIFSPFISLVKDLKIR